MESLCYDCFQQITLHLDVQSLINLSHCGSKVLFYFSNQLAKKQPDRFTMFKIINSTCISQEQKGFICGLYVGIIKVQYFNPKLFTKWTVNITGNFSLLNLVQKKFHLRDQWLLHYYAGNYCTIHCGIQIISSSHCAFIDKYVYQSLTLYEGQQLDQQLRLLKCRID